jgi:hypothetical protein
MMFPAVSKTTNGRSNRRPEVIFLTGAPDYDKLDWHHARLLADFEGRLRKYLHPDSHDGTPERFSASHVVPKWRTIHCSFDGAAAAEGPNNPQSETGVEFLSFEDDTERSEFLDHSLASFQRPEKDDTDGGAEAANSDSDYHTSFLSLSSTDISFESVSNSIVRPVNVIDIKFPDSIQDLKTLPSARRLLAIQPQTVTVHLLVGVIAVETRVVQLRKRTGQMELIELLVGDETAAPFKITFWLQHLEDFDNAKRGAADVDRDSVHRSVLKSIRTGDILLLTNVALDVFKNATYGQSLARRRAGCTTDVVNLSKTDVGSISNNARVKIQNVRQWARDFLGAKGTSRDLQIKRDALPDWSPVETSRAKRQRHVDDDLPSVDSLTEI